MPASENRPMLAWTTKDGQHHLLSQDIPNPQGRDILVKLKAAAMNPVDHKLTPTADSAILGFDGAGIVESVGDKAVLGFKKGDEVWFSGNFKRNGCFAEYAIVDERIMSLKPKTLAFDEAAAFPLVSLTSWEALEEGMNITPHDAGKTILIIGGAGGLGSSSIQIAKQQFNLFVVATASRPETEAWCRELGADVVINHHKPLAPQLEGRKIDYLFCTEDQAVTWDQWGDIMAVGGRIQLIWPKKDPVLLDDNFFYKRLSVGMELLFTRPMFDAEPEKQASILKRLSVLVDSGKLKRIDRYHFDWQKEIKESYKQIASGKTFGKIVLTGF